MLKRILVPIDFSDLSLAALHFAAKLRGDSPSELILLHVVDTTVTLALYPPEAAIPDMPFADARVAAEHHLAAVKKGLGHTGSVRTVIREGRPFTEILAEAKSGGVDLIVIGSHGRMPVMDALLGSTVDRVVRKAECPVLLFRDRAIAR